MKDIKFIQLEASAFLSDIDFQMMDAEERGIYCSIIFYLYCNGGKIQLSNNGDTTLLDSCYSRLAIISGCQKTGQQWEILWAKISHKFQINGNILTHKRVSEELKRASDYKKKKSEAGKKGMQNRYEKEDKSKNNNVEPNSVSNSDITKVSKGKVNKEKKNKKENGLIVIFEEAVKIYPGTKRGCETEFKNFQKHKDYREVSPLLLTAIKKQIDHRQQASKNKQFVPAWKNLQTWINNRCWEEQAGQIQTSQAEKICVVCRNVGKWRQCDDKGKDVWICDPCLTAFKKTGRTAFGKLPPHEIEKLVLKGKAMRPKTEKELI